MQVGRCWHLFGRRQCFELGSTDHCSGKLGFLLDWASTSEIKRTPNELRLLMVVGWRKDWRVRYGYLSPFRKFSVSAAEDEVADDGS